MNKKLNDTFNTDGITMSEKKIQSLVEDGYEVTGVVMIDPKTLKKVIVNCGRVTWEVVDNKF